MPNWCNNKLYIIDKKTKIKKATSKFLDEKGDIDFQKILPRPEGEDWYDWNIRNWGTKWSSSECSFNTRQNSVVFSTAWSPPLPVIIKLAELLKCELRLIYFEPGMGFAGDLVVSEEGECVMDNTFDLDIIPTYLKKEIEKSFGEIEWVD